MCAWVGDYRSSFYSVSETLTAMGPLIGIEMGEKKTQTDNLVSLWEKQYRLQ